MCPYHSDIITWAILCTGFEHGYLTFTRRSSEYAKTPFPYVKYIISYVVIFLFLPCYLLRKCYIWYALIFLHPHFLLLLVIHELSSTEITRKSFQNYAPFNLVKNCNWHHYHHPTWFPFFNHSHVSHQYRLQFTTRFILLYQALVLFTAFSLPEIWAVVFV